MVRFPCRATLPILLVLTLVACAQPTALPTPPALAEVVADTPALSSFVSLAEALDIDLDAVTGAGLFTVFAPSNALLDAYAVAWGEADAAAFLARLDAMTAEQTTAVAYMVRSHVVSAFPVLMTEDVITDVMSGTDWYWYTNPRFGADEEWFTAVENAFDADAGSDDLRLRFYGRAAPNVIDITVGGVELVASDVPFDNGVVHVVDGTITAAFIFAP